MKFCGMPARKIVIPMEAVMRRRRYIRQPIWKPEQKLDFDIRLVVDP
jgi:hypothetical protein